MTVEVLQHNRDYIPDFAAKTADFKPVGGASWGLVGLTSYILFCSVRVP